MLTIAIVSKLNTCEQNPHDRIREICDGDVELLEFTEDRDGLAERGGAAEIVYGNVRPLELPKLPDLKWVHATWTGVGNLLYPEMIDRGVTITNTRGQSARPMAEHILASLLYLARDLPAHAEGNRHHNWRPNVHASLLQDSHVLVLGVGAIGRATVPLLRALGAAVTGVNSNGRAIKGGPKMHTLESVTPQLGEIDHLVVLLPGTPHTKHVINRDFLSKLKPGATVVNVSRGSVLDADALVELIDAGHLRGAVLDVTEPEPLPEDSPLWDHPRVLITSHMSYQPTGHNQVAFDVFCHNLRCYREGRPEQMINLVDPRRGY